MMVWFEEYKEAIGAIVVGAGGLFAVIWAKVQSMRTDKAKTDANVAIAESQREVFDQMKERLTTQEKRLEVLEAQVDQYRVEVRQRDEEIHKMKMHVRDLEAIMRMNNIPVPSIAM